MIRRLGSPAIALLLFAPAQCQSPRAALHPCSLPGAAGEARCAKYEVFEDRAARRGRKIALNIVVLPAVGPSPAPDPLFWLHGGPGAAATDSPAGPGVGLMQPIR